MSDREAMKLALEALEWAWGGEPMGTKEQAAIQALRTALGAPKQEPVAWQYKDEPSFDGNCWHDNYQVTTSKQVAQFKDKNAQPLYATPPAAAPEPTHPGYVIGSHWLETAYSRVCAGEAEADVLRDCGWERVDEALRRDAERYRWGVENARWIRHEHEAYVAIPVAVYADLSCTPMRTAAIDAAMQKGDKT